MGGVGSRMPWKDGLSAAKEFYETYIHDYAKRGHILGSIRRGKRWVGDVEILAEPLYREEKINLFEVDVVNVFFPQILSLYHDGVIQLRRNKNGNRIAWGVENWEKKLPRYLAIEWQGMPIDLFICNPDRLLWWGYLVWLRTGPGDANRHMMMSRRRGGGLKPSDVEIKEGQVWVNGILQSCETEEDMFEVLQLEYVPPHLRSIEAYEQARKDWKMRNERMRA